MIIVRISHTRQLKYCSRGMREFCQKYGFDYSDFLENGIESSELLSRSNNDAMAIAAVEVARG